MNSSFLWTAVPGYALTGVRVGMRFGQVFGIREGMLVCDQDRRAFQCTLAESRA